MSRTIKWDCSMRAKRTLRMLSARCERRAYSSRHLSPPTSISQCCISESATRRMRRRNQRGHDSWTMRKSRARCRQRARNKPDRPAPLILFFTFLKIAGEERQIAAENNVGSQTRRHIGSRCLHKIAQKKLKRGLSLGERPLIECGEHLSGLDIRQQLGKQIGGDDLDLAEQMLLLERPEYGDAVGGADG